MHTFERRIYANLSAVVLVLIPLAAVTFMSLRRIIAEQRTLISVDMQHVLETERLRALDSTLSSIMPIYVLSGDSALLRRFYEGYDQFDDLEGQLAKSEVDPVVQSRLGHVKELSHQLRALAKPGIQMREHGASTDDVNKYFYKNMTLLAEDLRTALKEISVRENDNLEAAKLRVSRMLDWVAGLLIVLSAIALVLILFIGRLTKTAIRQKRELDLEQESELRHEQKISLARREVVEVVSHDLKNPLAAIKMSCDLMREQLFAGRPTPEFIESLNIVCRSADSMDLLIKGLLDHSKIESGVLRLEKTQTNFSQLVSDIAERFKPLARKRSIEFDCKIEGEGMILANCDPGRIDQVVSNIVGNALKFTDEGGCVHVAVKHRDAEVVVSVEDSGPGIEREELPHVFERLWHAQNTERAGHGLGLSIAKSIVDAHKGRIWVNSEKGKGSKFSFEIPVA